MLNGRVINRLNECQGAIGFRRDAVECHVAPPEGTPENPASERPILGKHTFWQKFSVNTVTAL
jgi:hypothetical protein